MGVKLRFRTLQNGDRRYYLDIWHNDQRWREFLQAKIKKSGYLDRSQKELKHLLEQIRNQREQELLAGDFHLTPSFKQRINFSDYFKRYAEHYPKKDKRKILGAYQQYLKHFGSKPIFPNQINQVACETFKDHLTREFRGETPHTYFTAFRKVIRQAIKEGFVKSDPTKGIRVSKGEQVLLKDVLTMDELQLLANTYCGNDQVKRAFLVCCFTGMGYTDITQMRWSQVKEGEISYHRAKLKSKNGAKVSIPVKSFVTYLCGDRRKPKEKVFDLPSENGSNKAIKHWIKRAGIDKHITFYCARHTFGCNLMLEGNANERTVADLLGHSSLEYVIRYTRHADELKAKAVERIPELKFENKLRVAK